MGRNSKNLDQKTPFTTKNIKTKDNIRLSGNSSRKIKDKAFQNKVKIFCNSLETEYNYFNKFALEVNKTELAEIKVEVAKTQTKGGKSPFEAVQYAIVNKENSLSTWVVFDKDEFNIEPAIKLAKDNDIQVAWSNECFELWLLYHFNKIISSHTRGVCLKKLEKLFLKELKTEYNKNTENIYYLLEENTQKAIRFARLQHQEMIRDNISPNNANPCSLVYQLVDFLFKRIAN